MIFRAAVREIMFIYVSDLYAIATPLPISSRVIIEAHPASQSDPVLRLNTKQPKGKKMLPRPSRCFPLCERDASLGMFKSRSDYTCHVKTKR